MRYSTLPWSESGAIRRDDQIRSPFVRAPPCPYPYVAPFFLQAKAADVVVRLSALNALDSLLGLWDLDAEQCLAPTLGWLLPALYELFEDLEEMDSRQQVIPPHPIPSYSISSHPIPSHSCFVSVDFNRIALGKVMG